MNYTENEISKMSNLGKLIFISPLNECKVKKYLILVKSILVTNVGDEKFGDK